VFEYRALNATEQRSNFETVYYGYFDDPERLIQSLPRIATAMGSYITLHPVDDDLLSRSANRIQQAKKIANNKKESGATTDNDITGYSWLPIDCDPKRKVGISSTDNEHNLALDRTAAIHAWLSSLGWPEPIDADSGNGAHLLYKINLPLSEQDLVKRVIDGIAERYSDNIVEVDQSVFNPSRIWKLYGTLACKGDSTTNRPHRMSRILHAPDTIVEVTREQLEQIAVPVPVVDEKTSNNIRQFPAAPNRLTSPKDILDRHHLGYTEIDGKFILDACVFDPTHTGKDAAVFEKDGKWCYHCFHNSCRNKGWIDFRRFFEPDYEPYDPLKQKKSGSHATNTQTNAIPEDTNINDIIARGNISELFNIIPLLAQLPKVEYLPYEVNIKSTFGKSLNMSTFNSAMVEARRENILSMHKNDGDEIPPESVAKKIVEMSIPYVDIFSNEAGVRYAKVLHNGHYETMVIAEKGSFRRWLHYLYEKETNLIPNSKALSDAIHTFEARAQFRTTKTDEVYLRIAYIEDTNTIYIDMANKDYQVIEVSAKGWRILDQSPVCFRRAPSMSPLPTPERGGSINELREFINVKDEGWILIKAWLLGCMQPFGLEFGEYAILAMSGGQGAAKTSAARRLRSIIDPSVAPLRKEPKDDQAFAIMAHNNFIVGLDNLSHISNSLSDSMCTLSTGAGDAYRKLYVDDEEAIFVAKRPQVFTGIEQLATRGDLLDRCLLVTLEDISDAQRKDSTDLNKSFKIKHPRILAGLLDCAVEGLKNRSTVKMAQKPRLADFAMFIVASERKLGLQSGEFMEVYNRNRIEGIAHELEASPVAAAVLKLMHGLDACDYTATELLQVLSDKLNSPQITKSKAWPQTPKGLSQQLKRLNRSLRTADLVVDFKRAGSERSIVITRVAQASSNDASSAKNDASSPPNDASSMTHDASMTHLKDTMRHNQNEATSDPSQYVTQSDAKYTSSLPLSDSLKDMSKVNMTNEEREDRGNVQTPVNMRHNASQNKKVITPNGQGFLTGRTKTASYGELIGVLINHVEEFYPKLSCIPVDDQTETA
jgi:hypothetical protein